MSVYRKRHFDRRLSDQMRLDGYGGSVLHRITSVENTRPERPSDAVSLVCFLELDKRTMTILERCAYGAKDLNVGE